MFWTLLQNGSSPSSTTSMADGPNAAGGGVSSGAEMVVRAMAVMVLVLATDRSGMAADLLQSSGDGGSDLCNDLVGCTAQPRAGNGQG